MSLKICSTNGSMLWVIIFFFTEVKKNYVSSCFFVRAIDKFQFQVSSVSEVIQVMERLACGNSRSSLQNEWELWLKSWESCSVRHGNYITISRLSWVRYITCQFFPLLPVDGGGILSLGYIISDSLTSQKIQSNGLYFPVSETINCFVYLSSYTSYSHSFSITKN